MKTPGEFEAYIQVHGEINRLAFYVEERDREHRSEYRAEIERAEQGEHEAIEQMKKWMAEVDRLKGELAEAEKRADALESLIDTERQRRKEAENTLFFVRKELAEARAKLVAALKDNGEPRMCYSVDCRYYGQKHATPHESQDDAKGEPGTMFCDEHGREDCGRPDHTKGAKP